MTAKMTKTIPLRVSELDGKKILRKVKRWKENRTKKRYVVEEGNRGIIVADYRRSIPAFNITVWTDGMGRTFSKAKARRIANAICKQLNEGGLK